VQLARQVGADKSKTWRAGFMHGWLGLPGTTRLSEGMTVQQAVPFVEGMVAGKAEWDSRGYDVESPAQVADAFRRAVDVIREAAGAYREIATKAKETA
jgi:hypothetical protein